MLTIDGRVRWNSSYTYQPRFEVSRYLAQLLLVATHVVDALETEEIKNAGPEQFASLTAGTQQLVQAASVRKTRERIDQNCFAAGLKLGDGDRCSHLAGHDFSVSMTPMASSWDTIETASSERPDPTCDMARIRAGVDHDLRGRGRGRSANNPLPDGQSEWIVDRIGQAGVLLAPRGALHEARLIVGHRQVDDAVWSLLQGLTDPVAHKGARLSENRA